MKRKAPFTLLLLFLIKWDFSRADHLICMNVSYQHVEKAKYEVTYVIYRNCEGMSNVGTGNIISVKCLSSGKTLPLNSTLISVKNVSNFCSTADKGCKTQNTSNSGMGIEEFVYKCMVDFNDTAFQAISACEEIIFEIGICCRPNSVNLTNYQYYNYAYLNRKYGEGNSSPQTAVPPLFFLCCNQPVYYHTGWLENNRQDSISYAWDFPLAAYGYPISYTSGYYKDAPLKAYYPSGKSYPYNNAATNPPSGFSLDQSNGNIAFTPVKCDDVGFMAVKATEWRIDSNGVRRIVGITRQDILFVVLSCSDNNSPVIFSPDKLSTINGKKIDVSLKIEDKPIFIKPPGKTQPLDTLSYSAFFSGKNGSISLNDSLLPQSNLRFTWNPDQGDVSDNPYNLLIQTEDNFCKIRSTSRKSIPVFVFPEPLYHKTWKQINCQRSVYDLSPDSLNKGEFRLKVKVLDSLGKEIVDTTVLCFYSNKLVSSSQLNDTIQWIENGTYIIQYTIWNSPHNYEIFIYDTVIVNSIQEIRNFISTGTCKSDTVKLFSIIDSNFIKYAYWNYNQTDTVKYKYINGGLDSLICLSVVKNNGCLQSAFFKLYNAELPEFSLGKDTILCNKFEIQLDGPPLPENKFKSFKYLWNDIDSTTAGSLIADTIGEYILQISNRCGVKSDSIVLFDRTSLQKNPIEKSFCKHDTLRLIPTINAKSYYWLSTKDTSLYLDINKSGIYTCRIKFWCGDSIDEEFKVTSHEFPQFRLPDNTFFCNGQNVKLYSIFEDGYTRIIWNDSTSDLMKNADKSGLYVVTAINTCGTFKDSCNVTEMSPPQISLGTDTLYCGTINRQYNFKNTDNTYQWSDNSTGPMFSITKPGTFWVKASNSCGSVTDSIVISQSFKPVANLGADLFLSKPFSRVLDAQNPGASYRWSNNSTGQTITVSDFGTYWVKVSTPCGESSDTVTFFDLLTINDVADKVLIYPNPADKIIYLEIDAYNGELLHLNGVKISEFEPKNGILQVDVSQLPQGIYFVKASTTKGFFISKVLVMH